MKTNLIFDIGMHRGLDTDWYLAKGFTVVAVEANPSLVGQVSERLSAYISDGRLIIENVGIADREGTLPFYVNLDNDEWSSFDEKLGTRNSTRYNVINIECVPAASLFEKYGVPYFAKIDIEGFDHFVVQSIATLPNKPKYASIEDNGFESLIEMYSAGAIAFKFVDQVEKWRISLPNPPLEGNFAEGKFFECTSGPFGNEVPGEWLPLDAAAKFYLDNIRPPSVGLQKHWWDIHGRFS